MKAGLVSCSNGQHPQQQEKINQLIRILEKMGMECVQAEHLYARDGVFGGTPKELAQDLMAFYNDGSIHAIYDVSGGDIANEVLGYLDYGKIADADKMFWGYSDLITVIKAIYAKTGKASVLYQVKHLAEDHAKLRQERFQRAVFGGGTDLFQISYQFLQGESMEGVVVGGNIRCLLKLAGTPYFPDMRGKILLLESLGSSAAQAAAQICQLGQMGVFDVVSGVLLGTFTKLEQSEGEMAPYRLLTRHIHTDIPVARTPQVGHSADAKAVLIGGVLQLGRKQAAWHEKSSREKEQRRG